MPREGSPHRIPLRILSKDQLLWSWRDSKDSKKAAGRHGIDGVSATAFASNLDDNLSRVARQIREGRYHFSGLHPVFIPKPNSDKERLICIPTVQDRLVQRTISRYLNFSKKLPIYNDVSFGFLPDYGLKKALERVLALREEYRFAFETDIISFFDEIDRSTLSNKIVRALGRRHSLIPLLEKVISCEIKTNRADYQEKIRNLGIRSRYGLRQGMPLSPALSNLALSSFDAAIQRAKLKMVRYADDIVVFAESEHAAIRAGDIVHEELIKLGHRIPPIGADSKTKIAGKFDRLLFLGREISFSERDGRYVQKVPKEQIHKVSQKISTEHSLEAMIRNGVEFPDFSRRLSSTVAAYLASYKNTRNFAEFESALRGSAKAAIRQIYVDIFGIGKIANLDRSHAKFLGIDQLALQDAPLEFEI